MKRFFSPENTGLVTKSKRPKENTETIKLTNDDFHGPNKSEDFINSIREQKSQLNTLVFSRCFDQFRDDEVANRLAEAVSECTKLNTVKILYHEAIDLDKNNVKLLYGALQNLPELNTLVFRGNVLGDASKEVFSLLAELILNSNIKYLDLSECYLGHMDGVEFDDIAPLIDAIASSTYLKWLDLRDNRLCYSEESIDLLQRLLKAVGDNSNIEYLDIDENELNEDVVEDVRNALDKNLDLKIKMDLELTEALESNSDQKSTP